MTKKEKLQEKINVWRTETFMLDNVKPGSKLERDLVKSYESVCETFKFTVDEVKNTAIRANNYKREYFLCLAFINKLIVYKHISRAISGGELYDFMINTTIGLCCKEILEKQKTEWAKLTMAERAQYKLTQCMFNVIKLFKIDGYTIYGYFLSFIKNKNPEYIFEGVMDFDAELINIMAETFILKNKKTKCA